MTLLTRVLLENRYNSYISFCHPEDPAATFWAVCVTKPQLSGILPVLDDLQELLLLLNDTAVVQLDHVLTSWMPVPYEKTARGLHRHTYHCRRAMHLGNAQTSRQTGQAKQVMWVLVGIACIECG